MTPTSWRVRGHRPQARRRQRTDSGQITLSMLGFAMVILFLGIGVTVETWRIVSAWRSVNAVADAAAIAGASGIDESPFRSSGGETVRLDPTYAERLAYQNLDVQTDRSEITDARATATTEHVTVTVHAQVNTLLLDTLRGGEPFEFTVTATADPRGSP